MHMYVYSELVIQEPPVKINVHSGGYHLVIDLYSILIRFTDPRRDRECVRHTVDVLRTYGRKIDHQHGEFSYILTMFYVKWSLENAKCLTVV